jgi:alanyl-tRNA synthetase
VSTELRSIIAANPHLDEQDIVQYPGFVAAFKELQALQSAQKLASADAMDEFLFKLQDTYGLDEDGVEKILNFGKIPVGEALESRLRDVKQRFRFQGEAGEAGKVGGVASTALSAIAKTNDQYKYDYTYNEKKEVYQPVEIEAEIRLVLVNGQECHIVTDRSNFYTESGGQEGDTGTFTLMGHPAQVFKVLGVSEVDGVLLHTGVLEDSGAKFEVGDQVRMSVDANRRTGNIRNHTATHLLNAAIRVVTGQPVCQKSSMVQQHRLRLELGILGKRVESSELARIEALVRQTIAAQTPVACDTIDSKRLLQLDNVTLVPGEIYPETDLRLLRIEAPTLSSAELCCGTHARNTNELLDFAVTNFRVTGRGSYQFTAVTGKEARLARRTGETMLDNVLTIKTDLAVGKQMLSDLEQRTQRLRNLLQNPPAEDNLPVPHLTKLQCLEILGEISRDLKKSSRESLRDMVDIEMNHLLQQLPKDFTHIVHFLETSSLMESVPLQKATKCVPYHPVLVLSLTDGVIKGRCCIPKHLVSDTFTAEKWLAVVGDVFQAQVSAPKGQSAAEVCNLKAKKVNNADFEEQLEVAIEKANEFADLQLGGKSMKDRSNWRN